MTHDDPPTINARPSLPTGTVTFLRTDVEGSMAIIGAVGSRWDAINATHLGILRRAVDAQGGIAVRTEGDALFAAFPEAGAAVAAAVEAQRGLAAHDWPSDAQVRVRMGLHSGEAHLAGDDYGGIDVNRAARIAAAGHGGQIILSGPTHELVKGSLPPGVIVRDLGQHAMRDVPEPESLFQLDVPGLRNEFPPLRVAASTRGNLPPRLTSFLGRDEAVAELRRLLGAGRLVTLTGPGGIGKTSLATELARAEAPAFGDGAWFVALDPIPDAASVPSVVARTIGLFDGPERPAADALRTYVAGRSMLFVLDNFEHVLDAAGIVGTILLASPGSRVIATSRAPLRLTGEQEYPVRPLHSMETEDRLTVAGAIVGHDSAMLLFIDRARAVRPGWEPVAEVPRIREICNLLDGLPLGIELAAARVSVLPVAAILDRLAAHLPLPGAGPRDAPDRQRTLEGAIDWSYGLLEPDLQHLLGDLSVFDGSFDIEQVQAVHDPDGGDGMDVLDGIVALVEQSLVVAGSGELEAGQEVDLGIRFRLLRTVADHSMRRVAAEGREADLRRRHANAFLGLVRSARPHLPSRDQARWLRRLALDRANISAAMEWAIGVGDASTALDIGASTWRFWQFDGHLVEGRALLDRALAIPAAQAPSPSRLDALAAAGGLAYWQADSPAARHRYEEQLALSRALRDRAAEVDAMYNLEHVYFLLANSGAPLDASDLDDDPDDPFTLAAYVADPLASMARIQEAYRELGDRVGLARCEFARATVGIGRGEGAAVRPHLEALLVEYDELDDPIYHAMTCGSLAWAAAVEGDMPTAARWVIQSILDSHALRDRATTTISLQSAIILALETGQPEAAATFVGAFEGLCERYGVRPPAALQVFLDTQDPIKRTREALPAPAFDALYERGRRMSLDEAVALVVRVWERAKGAEAA